MSYIGNKNSVSLYDSFTKEQAEGNFAPITRSRRNLLINGGFQVNKRGGGEVSSGGSYEIDRWFTDRKAANVLTSGTEDNSYSITGKNAFTVVDIAVGGLPDSDYVRFLQRIEGFNAVRLGWGTPEAKPVTLSFKITATGIDGDISVAFQSSNKDYSYVTTVYVDNTVREYTITIPGPTSGTFNTDETIGFDVGFCQGASQIGTYTTSTKDEWIAGDFIAHSTQVNGVAQAGDKLEIADVQLEEGETATDFEYRPVGEELALCQRYFQTSVTQQRDIPVTDHSGNKVYGTLNLYQPMRAAPVCSFSSLKYFEAASERTISGFTTSNINVGFFAFTFDITGGTAGNAGLLYMLWIADSEL